MLSNYKFILTIALLSLILYLLRLVILKIFKKLAGTRETILSITYHSIRVPSIIWVVIIATSITLILSNLELRKFLIFPIPKEYMDVVTKSIIATLILSITILIEQLITKFLEKHTDDDKLKKFNTGIISSLIRVAIYLVGISIILYYLGVVGILPVLTTLGIGTLPISLALRDTLSNLFSGVYITAERNIKVGDFIELENGKKGYIININWRTTKIRTLTNDLVIVPNEKLAQSIVYNYSEPQSITRVKIEIPVSYETDIDKFESIIMDETHKFANEDQRLLLDPPPTLSLSELNEISLKFSLTFTAKDYESGLAIQSELRKRLIKRLIKEDIEIIPSKIEVYTKQQITKH
jgi:small-conductance mechanosensitive channel